MSSNNYLFITQWQVEAGVQEVYGIIGGDAEDLARWWPSVYLDVKVLEPGDPKGVGKVVELYTKGWLPYTLKWKFVITESQEPDGFVLEAIGDFAGKGIWTFRQNGPMTDIIYDWRISAEKGMLKNLSWLMKPLFSANHLWAMRKGYESLLLELQRKRGRESKTVKPPGPTFPHNLTNNKIL